MLALAVSNLDSGDQVTITVVMVCGWLVLAALIVKMQRDKEI